MAIHTLPNGINTCDNGTINWGDAVNSNFKKLDRLLNKKTLTITSGESVLGTFNNSQDVVINIPENTVDNEVIEGITTDVTNVKEQLTLVQEKVNKIDTSIKYEKADPSIIDSLFN